MKKIIRRRDVVNDVKKKLAKIIIKHTEFFYHTPKYRIVVAVVRVRNLQKEIKKIK